MPDLIPQPHDLTSPRPAPVEGDALLQWCRVARALNHWREHQEEWAACEPHWPASFLQEEAARELGAALDAESAQHDG